MLRRLLILFILVLTCVPTAQAQIQVGLTIKRRLFLVYEPIIATVSLTNLSGRDIPLEDDPSTPWFGFQISRADDMPVPPHDVNYRLSPLILPAGQTIKRSVNLNALFPVHEFGLYRVKANVFFSSLQKYYESKVTNIEISEGKTVWKQTVGVPDGEDGAGGLRTISLLTFRQADRNMLYVRIQDVNTDTIYCTTALGRLVNSIPPEIDLDVLNQLHVLQVTGPKTYLYSKVGISGTVLGQNTYMATNSRPRLRRDGVGEVAVVGGILDTSENPGHSVLPGGPSAPGTELPKLSDRPADLPKE